MKQPPFRTPFDAETTAREVLAGVDLRGKQVVVTGASSGIGIETARELARCGALVHLAVRDTTIGRRVAADISADTGNADLVVSDLNLSDLRSVNGFVNAWKGSLDVLVCNAGVMATPLLRTHKGWELQFATNHIGHFALATGLRRSLGAADGARIVVVSSAGHRRSPVIFDDVHFENREYDPWLAYGQSKTANVLFAAEAAKRWADDGITANALHPGAIYTGLQRWIDRDESQRKASTERRRGAKFKTVEQGAATSALLAASPLVAGATGRYFEDCNEAELADSVDEKSGVQPFALDQQTASRLWDYTQHLMD